MSEIYNDIAKFRAHEAPVCRVAYTINNSQPVLCTIIDDQPLFYLDFEGEFEDDSAEFDAADLGILENELKTLEKQINAIDAYAEPEMRTSVEKVEEFLSEKAQITQDEKQDHVSLESLLETLSHSRLAQAYLDCAAEHDVQAVFSSQTQTACYDRDAGLIMINPYMDSAEQLLLISRELRRHYQHRQGALIHPLMFHPDNAVLVNRVQVADLLCSMIRIGWELQLSGEKSAWEMIESSTLADLGRAFAREAYMDFRTINNGYAMTAVFEAWFLTERCRAQDKILINQMLADYRGYVFDLDEAESQITPQLIGALGEMPFGKNYLAEHAFTIMEDPIFIDIRDRSNANFLWFIKFEKSFRETEQELQTSTDQIAQGLHSAAFPNEHKGLDDDAAHTTAEIVSLYDANAQESGDKTSKTAKRLSPKKTGKRNQKADTSNVVFLRWSGE